jgi:hypothetical protein
MNAAHKRRRIHAKIPTRHCQGPPIRANLPTTQRVSYSADLTRRQRSRDDESLRSTIKRGRDFSSMTLLGAETAQA